MLECSREEYKHVRMLATASIGQASSLSQCHDIDPSAAQLAVLLQDAAGVSSVSQWSTAGHLHHVAERDTDLRVVLNLLSTQLLATHRI